MIKRLLFILVVLISGTHVNAQSEFKKEWNIGIGAGPTFSNISMIENRSHITVKTKNTMQMHGGVSVRYITEKYFGLIAELNYAQMGWEGDFEDENTGITDFNKFSHTHKLHYLEIPLLTHIYFGSNKFRGFFNLGPKISFLLSEKEELNDELKNWVAGIGDGTDISVPYKHYDKSADNKIDYGLTAGAGVELRTKIGSFALEGRYYMGFSDIYKSSKSDDFSRSANREMSVRLTYYIKSF